MQQLLIITPCLNGAHYIDDTIMSVVAQAGDFAVHYHVQDGGSSDDTVDRLETWSRRLQRDDWPRLCRELVFSYSSGPDEGLYDAINRGFSAHVDQFSGDAMMAWINAGDRLGQGALQTVAAIRSVFPDVEWMSGSFAQINEEGSPIATSQAAAVSQKAIAAGLYDGRRLGFLQQEGVFWSHALWSAAGGRVDPALKRAGDFNLWRKLAAHSPCVGINSVMGFFRRHGGGLSGDINAYFAEIDALLTGSETTRRDNILGELMQLTKRNDREGLAKAGFIGPVILWNRDTNRWERKMALVKYQESGAA